MIKKQSRIIFLLVGLFLFLGCEKKEESADQHPQYADMKKYIEHKCTMCHFTDRIFKKKRMPSEWTKLVRRMRNRNRQWITAEDEARIINFLVVENSIPEEKKNAIPDVNAGLPE